MVELVGLEPATRLLWAAVRVRSAPSGALLSLTSVSAGRDVLSIDRLIATDPTPLVSGSRVGSPVVGFVRRNELVWNGARGS